jgi:capping protein beta
MAEDLLDYALDLMRRLPPTQVENNLTGLIDICPDIIEDLLSSVDQPLKIAFDKDVSRDYLLCDYNRDGDSYRSPWTNKYFPHIDGGATPSEDTRELETQMNKAINIYRDLYFEGGVSSSYLWDTDNGFAGCVLIKKTQDQTRGGQPMKGTWDSIHVFQVETVSNNSATYQLTSTVMLSIETETSDTGTVSLAGNLTRQEEKTLPYGDSSHIANIGSFIEVMENRLRETINTIYFGRTKDIVSFLRKKMGSIMKDQMKLVGEIKTRLGNKNN